VDRVYENDTSRYELTRVLFNDSIRWVIRFQSEWENRTLFSQQQETGEYAEDPSVGEYHYAVTDYAGGHVASLPLVTADIAANLFSGATQTPLGALTEGVNNRMRCRVRANALFLRMTSSGYPFTVERIGINVQPVGPRREVRDVV
jgi:hypothetical protein